ncbi:hypothetical protein STFE110948_00125 [Streptobacillus felis]|uniref:Tetratricopeptide repeat protein n=1 Tax=Streptobacillus felis TaxID=1384509 RepID=A0A7Z0PFW5_9FUSO|nr:hypothetical protein [Streptobacillus felis]NYV27963.1 hypothetical protein [Streptobacillus felis]
MKKLLIYLFLSLSIILNASIKSDFEKSLKLMTENRYEEAKIMLHILVEKKIDNIEDKKYIESANYYLANIYHRENKIKEAKLYYRRLSDNLETKSFSAIKSNQYLLSIAMEEGDMDEAINQTEILMKRTDYKELPFLSNLIYLYEINNKETKLQKLNKNIVSKLNEKDKGKLFSLLSLTYLENKRFDDAKRYLDLLLNSNDNENKQLGYLGYANFEIVQINKEGAMEYLSKALNLQKNTPKYILENINKIYISLEEPEKAYDVLMSIEKDSNMDANLIVELIKYAKVLDKKDDLIKYLNKLESMGISNYDLGIKMASENLLEYAEKYLIKSRDFDKKNVNFALINIYFSNQDLNKLQVLLEDMVNSNEINIEKKDSILIEYEHFQKYKNKRN